MYFIGTSSRLTVPIRDRKVTYHPATGETIDVKRALSVQFSPVGAAAPEYAKDAVSKLAGFGRGTGLDEDPFTRCGHLDTDAAAVEYGWDDEEKAAVEARLCSVAGFDFVRADAPALEAPWPKYDALEGDSDEVAKEIVATAEQIGVSAKYLADYERQNKNRAGLLAVFDILAAEVDEEIVAA